MEGGLRAVPKAGLQAEHTDADGAEVGLGRHRLNHQGREGSLDDE